MQSSPDWEMPICSCGEPRSVWCPCICYINPRSGCCVWPNVASIAGVIIIRPVLAAYGAIYVYIYIHVCVSSVEIF